MAGRGAVRFPFGRVRCRHLGWLGAIVRERKRVSLVVRGRSVALFRVLRFVVNFWWFVAKVQKNIDQSTSRGVCERMCGGEHTINRFDCAFSLHRC